ncbi:MAG: hypothetical protein H0U75_08210 [Legionella sp.]|nr:hypothetical protein [Legionella sp.]
MAIPKHSLFNNQPEPSNDILTDKNYYNAFNVLTESFKDVRQLTSNELSALHQSLSGLPLDSQTKQDIQQLSSPCHQQTMKALTKDNRNKLIEVFQKNGLMDLLVPVPRGLEEKPPQTIKKIDELSELNDIQCGYYRQQLYDFTYHCLTGILR